MKKKDHPLYYTWVGMMYRCYKPYHSHYKYYGAKGVTVDERWHNFWNFIDDVNQRMKNGHLLYHHGWTLDKNINEGKIYSLENCVVVHRDENEIMSRRKQYKRVLAYNEKDTNVFESLASASKDMGISRSTVISCIRRNNKHKSGYKFKYLESKG
ncbi:NUMOD1 domain-containing DNA-binding protein [Halobacillus litoralis]|uniref:NUMOD1 domain-containing DNA-binding protein n=1 Tax=Halobacillus litoralis TaxID=45668 RepID=UPI0024906BE9|nr:NUMOD1 domain-containing DNA-binding protein [Halobacillus litoralis]